jgi:putative ABC transport system permease protein
VAGDRDAHGSSTRSTVEPPAGLSGRSGRPLADTVYLQITGADRDAVRATASAVGGTLTATGDHLTAVEVEGDRLSRLGVAVVVGLALIFTAIAIANTMVMATGGRTRELATPRLAGATTVRSCAWSRWRR